MSGGKLVPQHGPEIIRRDLADEGGGSAEGRHARRRVANGAAVAHPNWRAHVVEDVPEACRVREQHVAFRQPVPADRGIVHPHGEIDKGIADGQDIDCAAWG